MERESTQEELRELARAEGQARIKELQADPEYLNRAAAIHEMIMDGMSFGTDEKGCQFSVSTGIVDELDLDVTMKAIEITRIRKADNGEITRGGIVSSSDKEGNTRFSYEVIVTSPLSDQEQAESNTPE